MVADLDLLEDAQDQMRQERMDKLIHQLAPYVIVLAILIVLGAITFAALRHKQHSDNLTMSNVLLDANYALEHADTQSAVSMLDKIINTNARNNIWALAVMSKASITASNGDTATASALYQRILSPKRQHIAPELQDAALNANISMLINSKEYSKAQELLDTRQVKEAFQYYNRLLKAIFLLETQRINDASSNLKLLVADELANPQVKKIATRLLAIIHNKYQQ